MLATLVSHLEAPFCISPATLTLDGTLHLVRLPPQPDGAAGTRIAYVYEAAVGGKVAAVGGRLLDGAARVIIGGFFTALARRAGGSAGPSSKLPVFLRRLLARLGVSA